MRTARKITGAVAAALLVAMLSGCSPTGVPGPPATSLPVDVLAASRAPQAGRATDTYDAPALHGALAKSISALGVDLLQSVEAGEKGNSVVSGFSAYSALAMARSAAKGTTLAEMRVALHTTPLEDQTADSAYADLTALLDARAKNSPTMSLDIANSMWLKTGYEVRPEFIQHDTDYFGAEVARIDMTSPEAPKAINRWVWENTGHRIAKLVDGLDPQTVAVLCNAIYFKDAWSMPFEKGQTSERDFHLADGSTVKVPTMLGSAGGSYIDTATFQACTVGTKGGADFWVFVPKGSGTPADVLASLKSLYAAGTTPAEVATSDTGQIYLPKFDIQWRGSLVDALEGLGMRTAFDPNTADFSGLTPSPDRLWISSVMQAATTRIDEEGLEAAAATEVGIGATAAPVAPFEMHVDRPFVYGISVGDAMLFIGVVNDPR